MDRLPIVEVNAMRVDDDLVEKWTVEAIDDDGGIHSAEFYGRYAAPDAELWAATAYPDVPLNFVTVRHLGERAARPRLTVVGGTAL